MEWRHALLLLGFVVYQAPQTPPPRGARHIPRIELQVDDKGADVAPWASEFILLVDRNWSLPPEAETLNGHVAARFNVDRDGKISDLAIVATGAPEPLTVAVRDAIGQTSLFQTAPSNYPGDRMPVAVTAYYNEAPPRAALRQFDPPAGVYDAHRSTDVTLPRLVHEEKPRYTPNAMRAQIQGSVVLGCVVDVDGSVRDVQVLGSLDPWLGLDAEAIKAAKLWTFSPGTRSGDAVPVWITLQMAFTLK